MDRNREGRRGSVAVSNGLARRRHRSGSLKDSPEDGQVEVQEAARIRDRKKHRDRDNRDRSSLMMNKRRRGGDGGGESTEESVNDDEDEDEEDRVRMLPPTPVTAMYSSSSVSVSVMNHNQQQNQHRKSFPPAAVASVTSTKIFKPVQPWLATDEKICVSVPRKARSASVKRSHECWASSGGGGSGGSGGVAGEPIPRQASTSPVRASIVSASPVSPSSSSISARKKMKSNGHKHRPPLKSSSKSSSSNQDDIEMEIEIAEVLYGMKRQPQGPSKQEIIATNNESMKPNLKEVSKTTSGDAKSRVSSPISNLPAAVPPQSSILPSQNSSSAAAPVTASAIKRKRPRPVNYNEQNPARNNTNSFTTKGEINQPPAINGPPLSNSEKNTESAFENSLPNSQFIQGSLMSRQEAHNAENRASSDSKPPLNEGRDGFLLKEEDSNSPEKTRSAMLRFDGKCDDSTSNKANSMAHGNETKREEKFQIDLMAPPFQMRLSPEREGEVNFGIIELKPIASHVESERKFETKEDVKTLHVCKDDSRKDEHEEKKVKSIMENTEPQRQTGNKERFLDLQLDLEKNERDCSGSLSGNQLSQNVAKHQQKSSRDEPTGTEKTVHPPGSLPLQMSMANWPGGLPPMGYMTPLHQGVVSMDGSSVSSAAVKPQHCWPLAQPGTKRCATHGYIARAIHYSQRLPRMNPFLPTAASSASLYGSKPCNSNAVPSSEIHGNIQGRAMNSGHEKGHSVAMFPGHVGKDKGSEASNIVDAAQRKQQIVLQQALQPGAPNNIMHGPPAYIFPLSQQQPPALAASLRPPGSLKSPATGASGTASTSASVSAAATGVVPLAAAPPMSFNYPNMAPANEAQYLAILQNSGYPFPIPAHVGGPPPAGYRGNHPQAMPFFNGSFYSPQILHPSQAQPQQPPQSQAPQISQGHQNPTISSSSSSSHKHLQNLHQRSHGGNAGGSIGANGVNGSLQGYSASKNQPPQQIVNLQNQLLHLPRQLESEAGGEDSPSTADSRLSRANMNVYAQNFAMPIHPQNFALMSHPASMNTVGGGPGNPSEKKQQPPQNHGMKTAGVESISSPAFAMSYASFNGVVANSPSLDISSMGQNHTILQNFPEAARQHGYHQIMAPAQATHHHQQKKGYRSSDEQKNGGGGGGDSSSNADEERKSMTGKIQATGSQSIAFSRADLSDTSGSTVPVNTVIDTSARNLGLGPGPTKAAGSNIPVANSHQQRQSKQQMLYQQQRQQQFQQQHQYQQQVLQRQKQQSQNVAATAAHNPPSSSAMSAKFSSNSLSAFPQNVIQNSATQSPQWKNQNPSRTSTPSQANAPTIIATTASSLKNLPHQQQGRTHQSHAQISFTNMPKSSPPSTSQAPSPPPPMVAGSPTNSSLSKGATGSPRAGTVTSTGNKGGSGQVSMLSPQLGKSSPAAASRKSSPVGGRSVPSILGNKPQLQQPIQQQSLQQQPLQQQPLQQPNQFTKQGMQQAQIFFSNSYQQNQAFNSTMSGSTGSATSGFYTQRRRPEHHQQLPQSQSPPVTLASAATSEPVKTTAAASSPASNMKGGGGAGGLPPQGNLESSANQHQLVPAGFSYAVPTPVQVKATEQKQPAGE